MSTIMSRRRKNKVFIVSDTDKEQVTYEGMPFRANYTIDNGPRSMSWASPAGRVASMPIRRMSALSIGSKRLPAKRNWLRRTVRERFCLAKLAYSIIRTPPPSPPIPTIYRTVSKLSVQGDGRVVIDGNLITSPGGLASYEASLYVVEQLFGKDQA